MAQKRALPLRPHPVKTHRFPTSCLAGLLRRSHRSRPCRSVQEGALGEGGAEWLKAPLSVTGREEGEWTVQPNGEGQAYAIGQGPQSNPLLSLSSTCLSPTPLPSLVYLPLSSR